MDLDELLRTDAARWRAAQPLDLDLGVALEAARPAPLRAGRHGRTVAAAAAAVVLMAGGAALVTDHLHTGPGDHAGSDRTSSHPTTAPSVPPPARLSGLGNPSQGERTLLRSSGHTDTSLDVGCSTGSGEIYAACLGGGTITVDMPGSGGLSVDCDGTASGAGLPTLGRTVRIVGVTTQQWRIAVFGH